MEFIPLSTILFLFAGGLLGGLGCWLFNRIRVGSNTDELAYRSIIDASLHGVIIHREFKPLFINRKTIDIFGYSGEDEFMALDSVLESLVHRDYRDQMKTRYQRRIAGTAPEIGIEFRGLKKSGEEIWLEVNSRAIEWQGETAVLGLVSDISQRKQIELELLESERLFRNVFNQQFQFMAILDTDGRILSINDMLLKMFGVSREEILGEYFWLAPAWQDSPELQSIVRSHIEVSRMSDKILEFEGVFKSVEGESRIARAAYLALHDDEGEPEFILVQATDITEQMIIERNLMETREREHLVLQSASMGTWEWDIVNDEVIWSAETCRIFATDKQRFGGNLAGYLKFTNPDDIAELETTIGGFLENASPSNNVLNYQHRMIREDHSRGWVEVFGRLFFDQDQKPLRMTGICIDISQRKQAGELLEQKNMELERFTYTVSHELKSPLVTINGFLGLLGKDIDSGNQDQIQKSIGYIASAVETMGQQLDDLLELSRIGRIVRPSIDFSLSESCEEVVQHLAGIIQNTRARIVLSEDMHAVHADPQRVKEILQSLLENAIKFSSQDNRPEISISSELKSSMVVCRVQDNGPGIDPDYHARIFNLFDRLETEVPGTGIGLAVAKRIVEVHGGEIWVESDGKANGTTMLFTLPVALGEQGQPLASATGQ